MKRFLLTMLLLLCASSIYAQGRRIEGRVTSEEDGEPLIGVSVTIKGTYTGVATDVNGHYAITLPTAGEHLLVFTYIGYSNEERRVSGATTTMDVVMRTDATMIEEVVAIGYGTMRKSDLTGAVASVSSEQLTKTPAAGIDKALQGRAAGVTVNASSGQPGAGAEVRIRGIGTVNDSSPIYVVDGVITSDINYLNPNDIASTEILKDASSTAIYGSRGANGVIIITTKSGSKQSKVNVEFNAYVGIQNRWNKLSLMGTEEQARTEVTMQGQQSQINYFNQNGFNQWLSTYKLGSSSFYPVVKSSTTPNGLDYSAINTDWQDEVFKANAVIQNYHLAVSGGSDKSTYAISASYFNQDGTIMGSNFNRLTLRANTTYTITKWLKIGENISFVTSEGRNAMNNSSSPGASVLSAAIAMAPWDPTHYPEGSYNAAGEDLSGRISASSNFRNVTNPFSMVEMSHPLNKSERWIGNIFLELQPVKGLTFRSEVSMDLANGMNRTFKDKYYYSDYDKNDKNFISRSMSRAQTMRYDNILTYNGEWGKHSLTAMVGQTTEQYNYYSIGGSGSTITNPAPNNWYLNQATEDLSEAGDSALRTRMFSLLGRVHYSYDNRYLITLNFRADASSKFPENLWGYFPSTAIAWRISEESFLEDVDILDNLKLRFGWGQIGNDKIGSNSFTQLMFNAGPTFVDYPLGVNQELVPGATVLTYVNTGGKWETTEQLNLGVDLSMWGGKLIATVDLFKRDTKDMLLSVAAPAHVGNRYASTANVGTVTNKGLELTLAHYNRIGEVGYSINGNVSFIKNELVALNGGERVYGDRSICDKGLALWTLWGYEYEGIYRTNEEVLEHQHAQSSLTVTEHAGDARYKDQNGDGLINDDDLVDIGNPFPWLTYGLNLGLDWKGLDVSIFFQGVAGNEIYNALRLRTEGKGQEATLSTSMRDVWSITNPKGSIPNPWGSSRNFENSSRYVESGAYLRLKDVTIGYTLPKKWTDKMHMNRWRFYISASNLLTFTNYSGYDPEVGGGVDYGNYPQSRTIMFGTNINF